MNTKQEINQLLGKKPFFKKLPYLDEPIKHVKGLTESINRKNYYITLYPKGILLSESNNVIHFAFPYHEISYYDIYTLDSTNCVLIFVLTNSKKLEFTFVKRERSKIVSFLRFTLLKNAPDPRSEIESKNEIAELKSEFLNDNYTNCHFSCELKSITKKSKLFEANKQYIVYGEETRSTLSSTGYALGIYEVVYRGVSRFEYTIKIYIPDNPLMITFASVSMFLKEGEHSNLLNEIDLYLFDVISRPLIGKWLDEFANNKKIEFNDYTISKEGLTFKRNNDWILIHWDEIRAQTADQFRWPYSNTVFFDIVSSLNPKALMLFHFVKWLNKNPDRFDKLMGRRYY